MAGKFSRSKGAKGELELFRLLSAELGFPIKRNLKQYQGTGPDTLDIPGWSLECKRKEDISIGAWWQQTVEQCPADCKPVLFYRKSNMPWSAVFRICDISSQYPHGDMLTVGLLTACMIIREGLD